ncbi:MAG: hypothetical protein JWN73_1563 [Betaproteobacteria bacterium]|nr:hypothetical protein [Betaproteobacteria bacterium]
MRRAPVRRRWAALFLAFLCGGAFAQAYPAHPVKLIVPFPAGTSTDFAGREVAQLLTKATGQSFYIENRPGAQGTIGAAVAARAPRDGYTLFFGNNTTQAAAAALFKELQYDPVKDFEPIGRVGAAVQLLTVRADLPVQTVEQLFDYGRKNAGKLRWGYANSANQIAGSAVVRAGSLEAIGVPYKGVPEITTDLIGGVLDFTVADLTNMMPMVKAGKLRALAVTSENTLADLPGVPTLAQSTKGFTLVAWFGLFAPAGTPAAITAKLSQQLRAGLSDPGLESRMKNAGLIVYPGNAEEFRAFIGGERVKWTGLIKATGITPQ